SMLGVIEAARANRDVRRMLLDPHGLDPERGKGPRDPFEDDQRTVHFDKDIGRWTAPFLMSTINTRVVRRSHALFRETDAEDVPGGYGERFRYNEAMSFRLGPRGFMKASMLSAGMAGVLAAGTLPFARGLLERFVLPGAGEGPSRESIESGFFEVHILAKTESGKHIRGRVAGTSDPGYGETAKMLSETAFCLAKHGAPL